MSAEAVSGAQPAVVVSQLDSLRWRLVDLDGSSYLLGHHPVARFKDWFVLVTEPPLPEGELRLRAATVSTHCYRTPDGVFRVVAPLTFPGSQSAGDGLEVSLPMTVEVLRLLANRAQPSQLVQIELGDDSHLRHKTLARLLISLDLRLDELERASDDTAREALSSQVQGLLDEIAGWGVSEAQARLVVKLWQKRSHARIEDLLEWTRALS